MSRKVILAIVIVLIILGGVYAVYYLKFRTTKIEDTANVVENIKKIGQFTSMHYFADMVVVEAKDDDFSKSYFGRFIKSNSKDELVLIAKCVVNAGFDLQKVSPESVSVSEGTISLVLPAIEIFDIIINPSDVEVFQEKGKWSHDEMSAVSMKAKDTVIKEIADKELLQKASESGIAKLKEILKALGFAVVDISVAVS